MAKKLIGLLSILLTTLYCFSAIPERAFTKEGNLFIQFDNSEIIQITFKGQDSDASMASNRKFIVFLRTVKNPDAKEEGEQLIDETSIILYNLENSKEQILVQGCKFDGEGSSKISYSDSEGYPFTGLCNIQKPILSPDNERIYFETTAWTVSAAIHFCSIPTGMISFFHAGSLNEVLPNGNLSINVTETRKNKGRYYQDWLFDSKGKAIKALGKKE
jgi:hypothetical protein